VSNAGWLARKGFVPHGSGYQGDVGPYRIHVVPYLDEREWEAVDPVTSVMGHGATPQEALLDLIESMEARKARLNAMLRLMREFVSE